MHFTLRSHLLRRFVLSLMLVAACDSADSPKNFDPTGTDSELYCEWDVNGLIPDTDVCARAGIDTVGIVFTNADSTDSFTSDAFRWPCSVGYYDSPGPLLAEGILGYQWRAYSGDTVVLESRRYSTYVTAGVEVVLMPVDFVRRIGVAVDVALSYQADVGYGGCSAALVDSIAWELRADTATGAVVATSDGNTACVDGFTIPDLPTGLLQPGPYVLVMLGSATDGSMWSAECALTVYESGPSSVTCSLPRVP